MVNAESGDYGFVEQRDCGCALGALGLTTHVIGLHGYDKLTSEGVNFLGGELYDILEQVMPARFGGNPTDYQLVEQEDEHGIPKVNIIISPSVGPVDERDVVTTLLEKLSTLGGYQRGRLMTEQWMDAQTVTVLRQEPYTSGERKVLPLHILRPEQQTQTRA
jgi:hypothetical protein